MRASAEQEHPAPPLRASLRTDVANTHAGSSAHVLGKEGRPVEGDLTTISLVLV